MRLPRHSTVAAYAALFVALGGTSYAAVKLPRASVGTREIKNGSVRTTDLAKTARPPSRARLASVVEDVITDPVSGVKITVKGEKGADGAQGPAGPAGPSGTANVTVRTAVGPDVSSGDTGATALCLAGERIVGGGARFEGSSGANGAIPVFSIPDTDNRQGWGAAYTVTGPVTGHVRTYALCAA